MTNHHRKMQSFRLGVRKSILCHDGVHPESIAKPHDDRACRCGPLYYFICSDSGPVS